MEFQLGIWRPDRPVYAPNAARAGSVPVSRCQNWIRQAGRWEPVAAAMPHVDAVALPAAPVRTWRWKFSEDRLYIFVEAQDGHIYAKEPTGWTRVTTNRTFTQWSLEQWNDLLYATTRGQRLQKWTPPARRVHPTPQFAVVPDAPEDALIVKRVRDFLVLANFPSAGNKVWWSGLQKPDEWVAAQDFSDSQHVGRVGDIHDILVYEDGFLFGSQGISQMSLYGVNFTFQFDTLTQEFGVEDSGFSIAVGSHFWVGSSAGFIRYGIGDGFLPIGMGQVDTSFSRYLDEGGSDKLSVFFDSVRKTIRWNFPRKQNRHPDDTLIYCLESNSWGRDTSSQSVRFVDTTEEVTFDEAHEIFGPTFGEFGSIVEDATDPRLAGGVDILFGFDDDYKPGPATARHDHSVLTTNLFSPLRGGRDRVFVTGVRPWTDGNPIVRIATTERRSAALPQSAFVLCDPIQDTGEAPAEVSGRYIQIQFDFQGSDTFTYINGFDLEFSRDGQI